MAKLPDLQQILHDGTMECNTLLFSFLVLSVLLLLHKVTSRCRKLNLPPSPPRLPLIGNLHQLRRLPHHSLRALSDKCGPLMIFYMGHSPALVVSSAEIARKMMTTHDIVFSNRPKSTASGIISYQYQDVGFTPYGEYWRQVKKICVLELLSLKKVQSFQFVREEEVAVLIEEIRCVCLNGASVNLSAMLPASANNIVSRCILGQKAEKNGNKTKFGALARRIMKLLADFSFRDTIRSLGWLDNFTGFNLQLKTTFRAMDEFLDRVVEEHKNLKKGDDQFAKKDFVDILLQLQENGSLGCQLNKDNLKAVIMDMFVGGTDTTSTTMEWVMAELMRNQNVMKKAQEEVRRVMGRKAKVEADDIDKMNYLKCIIKETLRLHSPAPLLVPRETSASAELGGYTVPPETKVIVNAFAIQRDPKVWERPDEFFPDRFEKKAVDFRGQDFQFIPFGGGRRICPGITFGVTSAEFVIANVLHWFDWKLPDGAAQENLDMSEEHGLTVSKKIPLRLVPTVYST